MGKTLGSPDGGLAHGVGSRRMRLLLASSVIITGLTAHLGGLLDRGVDFFTY
jgi:hypothetical protein